MTTTHYDYHALATRDQLPLFSQPWWLDAACAAAGWDVVVATDRSGMTASMPYTLKRRGPLTIITQPDLTQKLGITFTNYETLSGDKYESTREKLTKELFEKLPHYHVFTQTFDQSYGDWLPLHWQGCSQSTRYSFELALSGSDDERESNFSHAKRKNLRRAEKLVTVREDLDVDQALEHLGRTLQGDLSYPPETLGRIMEASFARGQGKIFYAIDQTATIHSFAFFVWDDDRAYFLVSSVDPEFRNSGSLTLLVAHAMRWLSPRVGYFDFEGSMIQGVARSFRQFSGSMRRLHAIEHVPNRLLRTAYGLVAS